MINFLETNAEFIFNNIKEDKHFPYICDKVSLILGTYLKEYFNEPIKIIDGFFGFNEERHCWIDINEYKIDFTLSQFMINTNDDFDKLKSSPTKFIKENNIPIVVDKDKYSGIYKKYSYESYSYMDVDYVDIYLELLKLAKENRDFKVYLIKALSTY